MNRLKVDAERVLSELAKIRRKIPHLQEIAPRRAYDGRFTHHSGFQPRDAEDFEYMAIADALRSFVADLDEAMAQVHASAMEKALDVYYAGVELIRDPEYAHLIPQVEKLREAYERDTGAPIPPKSKH